MFYCKVCRIWQNCDICLCGFGRSGTAAKPGRPGHESACEQSQIHQLGIRGTWKTVFLVQSLCPHLVCSSTMEGGGFLSVYVDSSVESGGLVLLLKISACFLFVMGSNSVCVWELICIMGNFCRVSQLSISRNTNSEVWRWSIVENATATTLWSLLGVPPA
jgi:hypothetical protein